MERAEHGLDETTTWVFFPENFNWAFYDDRIARGFLHSHSYTGNALACRAALATLDIFEHDDVIEINRTKAARFDLLLQPLARHSRVRDFRRTGMIWAFEVESAATGFAQELYRQAAARELLLRPIGNTVYFMPPYVVTDSEFAALVAGTAEIVECA